jgi:hypothetical protein
VSFGASSGRASRRPRSLGLLAAVAAIALAGCGGGSSAGKDLDAVSSPAPNFQAFLRLPVATPSACPSNVNGTSDGRTSVWAGRVDLSVFMSPSATTTQTLAIGNTLRTDSRVQSQSVYFETRQQAYEEFQRLYTCWAGVPRSQTPASYRVDLKSTVSITARNALVFTVSRLPGVDYVACNPLIPCTSSLPSAPASSGPSPSP